MQRFSYEKRMTQLGLWSLEERRNRSDLIEVFKILKGFSTIAASDFFDLSLEHRTRGHSLKRAKHRCSTTLRQHFLSERVIKRWNSLDEDTVSADTANSYHLARLRSRRRSLFLD